MDDLAWVRWWCRPWQCAQDEWWPEVLAKLPRASVMLERGHHQSMSQAFGIAPVSPALPTDALRSLVAMDDEALALSIELAISACYPQRATSLPTSHQQWCKGIARGLRPEQWLTPENDILALLRTWVGVATWQRLRLRLPKQRVVDSEAGALMESPARKRLEMFWGAVTWRTIHYTNAEATCWRGEESN